MEQNHCYPFAKHFLGFRNENSSASLESCPESRFLQRTAHSLFSGLRGALMRRGRGLGGVQLCFSKAPPPRLADLDPGEGRLAAQLSTLPRGRFPRQPPQARAPSPDDRELSQGRNPLLAGRHSGIREHNSVGPLRGFGEPFP